MGLTLYREGDVNAMLLVIEMGMDDREVRVVVGLVEVVTWRRTRDGHF